MLGPEATATPPGRPATLSACILSWNGERRLPGTIASLEPIADEIVVGVDSASEDRTEDVARAAADRVFRFGHPGTPEPARLLFLDQATSDWILLLDDDERLEPGFHELIPSLLADPRYTHYAFPRKWIVPGTTDRYVRALPWFPDWQVRLFRNDRTLVWHAPASHSGYRVVGPGCRENRAALLHYERSLRPTDEREGKVQRYRTLGGGGRFEEFYEPFPPEASTPLERRPADPDAAAAAPRPRAGVLDPTEYEVANRSPLPPWGARLDVRLPDTVPAGEAFVAELDAMNAGGLRWTPPTLVWPRLFLSYHVRDPAGEVMVWDGARTPVGRVVDPGESAAFLPIVEAPDRPGDYVLEFDLVDEGECWFAECGSATACVPLRVAAASPTAASPR
jgi:hypothetical protein